MADVVFTIDRGIPSGQRYIVVTQADLSNGDIVRIIESIGRSADTVTVEADAGSDLEIVLNAKRDVAKRRQYPEEHPAFWSEYSFINVNDVTEHDTGLDRIVIGDSGAAVTFVIDDVLVNNLQVFFTTGDFSLLFS